MVNMSMLQVAVALVKKMELDGSIGPQEMARTFAKQLHAQWGVGLADCDNGVLLFLSMKDKQIFISTGKGSEEHLSNESIDVILEWMKPYLRKGDYDEALIRAVSNIGLGLSGWNISSDEPAFNIGMIIFFVFFGLVAFSLVKGFWYVFFLVVVYAYLCECICLFTSLYTAILCAHVNMYISSTRRST